MYETATAMVVSLRKSLKKRPHDFKQDFYGNTAVFGADKIFFKNLERVTGRTLVK